jgi:adenylylsulfate kinase
MNSAVLTDNNKDTEALSRSIVKTVSYRLLIVLLDFSAIYWLSGKVRVAFGFTLISNVYTTVGYFFHERIWNRIKWGKASDTFLIVKTVDEKKNKN